MLTDRSDAYRWVRTVGLRPTLVMATEGGGTTADMEKIHDMLIKFWKGLFTELADKPDLSVREFMEEYGQYIRKEECPEPQ
eukprot:16447484-Heterocapsa_arctica.AAC.1